MAGMGAGYDLSVATFSPDGRVFQVEYAAKAVDKAGVVIAIILKDGLLFAVEKLIVNPMAIPGTAPRIFAVDRHATIAVAGFVPDGRAIVARARSEATEYRRIYGEPIPGKVLSERLALFMHAYTLAWTERPFGASILLGVAEAVGEQKPRVELYAIDIAGVCYRYFGAALGKGKQMAITEIEQLNREDLSCEQALVQAARIVHRVHDETKEKQVEVEMAWLCEASQWQPQMVPRDLVAKAVAAALSLLEAADEDEPMS